MPTNSFTKEDKTTYFPLLRKLAWEKVHHSTWKGDSVKHGEAGKIVKKIKLLYEGREEFSMDTRAVRSFMNGKRYSDKTVDRLSGFVLNDINCGYQSFKDAYRPQGEAAEETGLIQDIHLLHEAENSYLSQVDNPRKLGMFGGVIGGVITFFLTIIFKDYLGYQNLELRSLNQLLPIMFLSYLVLGALLGWVSVHFSQQMLHYLEDRKRVWIKASLVIFVLSIVLRGLKARDSNFVGLIIGGEQNGVLGEPNFEVLATSLAMVLCALFIIHALAIKKRYKEDEIVKYSLLSALISSVTFALVFVLYKGMILGDFISKGSYLISSSIFKFTFSHPERVSWVFLTILITVYAVLKTIKIKADAAPVKEEVE